jgi:DNA-binding NarL/FixJ family response regulator
MELGILVVDDEPLHRRLLRSVVEPEVGLRVIGEAHHGRRAVELAAELQPDVVVLDLRMPTMDGLTALPLLRRVSPGSRIVVWSNDDELQRLRSIEAGAAACVRKFDAPALLIAALRDRRDRGVDGEPFSRAGVLGVAGP